MSNDILAAQSSRSVVAGQQTPASTAMVDYQEIISTHAWVDQMWNNDIQYDSPSSPPDTPSLYWGSEPSSAELRADQALHSVFEDWDDDLENVANLSASVIIEEDGAQTLLIPPDGEYYNPPTPQRPFGSTFAIDIEAAEADLAFDGAESQNQVQSIPSTPPNTSATALKEISSLKGLILHIDTSFLESNLNKSGQADTLLSSMLPSSQPGEEDASWDQRLYVKRPDVPFDCSFSAGDGSPMVEPWDDEPLWSPVIIPAFRSAPCF